MASKLQNSHFQAKKKKKKKSFSKRRVFESVKRIKGPLIGKELSNDLN
jgi:hypothetical protein